MDATRAAVLRRQFDLSWSLLDLHLRAVSDGDLLWEPVPGCWTVRPAADGRWVADWVEPEPEPSAPPTLGWLTWHLGFWLSMVTDHSFGPARLTREDVAWPGDADGTRRWLDGCRTRWLEGVAALTEADLDSGERTAWPYRDGRPFAHVLAWANVELTKNAAEIGMLRFLRGAPSAGACG